MQPGSHSWTRELNTLDDIPGDQRLPIMGYFVKAESAIAIVACMSLATVEEVFNNSGVSHIQAFTEGIAI